jgi:hypothetical protein
VCSSDLGGRPSATPMTAAITSTTAAAIGRTGSIRIRPDTFLPKRTFAECGVVDLVIDVPREFGTVHGPSDVHASRAVRPFGIRHFETPNTYHSPRIFGDQRQYCHHRKTNC